MRRMDANHFAQCEHLRNLPVTRFNNNIRRRRMACGHAVGELVPAIEGAQTWRKA
jgi:hypothetical protein